MVGDDVVQLAGDALALLEQRALALVPAFLDRELLAVAAPGADDHAGQHRDRGGEDGGRGGLSHRSQVAPTAVTTAAVTTTHASQRTATAYRHRT